jgi:hypothetical protein
VFLRDKARGSFHQWERKVWLVMRWGREGMWRRGGRGGEVERGGIMA